MNSLKSQLASLCDEVISAFPKWVPSVETPPTRIHEAMNYSLAAGGKRLRPMLILAAARLADAPRADPLPAAVAIECLHTYSLIHDDLPGMDNSDLRRGRPTCHKAFDQATAILAGDALLTLAFEILGRAYQDDPELGLALVRLLGKAAGSELLIGGQMRDILGERTRPDAAELERIHEGKTAALFSASLEMGGLLGGLGKPSVKALREAGYAMGMAFQVVDDILDATSTSEQLGKQAGLDEANNTLTMVSLHGLEGAREIARSWTQKALEALGHLPGDTTFLKSLIQELENRMV
jgi:geranylgeranyl diphosphate synthase type II